MTQHFCEFARACADIRNRVVSLYKARKKIYNLNGVSGAVFVVNIRLSREHFGVVHNQPSKST
jgi:hypothetical protein